MKHPVKPTSKKRFLVPWALFAGVAVSFAACCFAGHSTTKVNQLDRFHRFHRMLCQESLFYPTASQVQQLTLARTKKDRINVIIGGSSVLIGTGQQAHEVWSDQLARLLGPDYRVLNLALRGGRTGEFGALAAEMAFRRRQVIFVTDTSPGDMNKDPDGLLFRYFFWDAYFKKLIKTNIPARAKRVGELFEERASKPEFGELVKGGQLDAKFHFNDLWGTLAYTHGGTMWNLITRERSFEPRRNIPDNEPAPPPLDKRIEVMGRYISFHEYADRLQGRIPFVEENDAWVVNPVQIQRMGDSLLTRLPNEELRRRSILVLHTPHPHILRQYNTEELQKWNALVQASEQELKRVGFVVAPTGSTYSEEDYADQIHLAASGGNKLAGQLAPMIRELAAKLGYKATPRPTTGNE